MGDGWSTHEKKLEKKATEYTMPVHFPTRPSLHPALLCHIDETVPSSTPRDPPLFAALATRGQKQMVKLDCALAPWWVGVEAACLEPLLSFSCSLSVPPGVMIRS